MRDNPYAPNPELKIWLDGKLVPSHEAAINVFDHGILYGDGVFEGIRVYNGKIFREKDHIDRLFESARAIRLEIPHTYDEVSKAMHDTMAANGITGDGYIRLVVTRGVGSLGISIKHTACPTMYVIAATIALYPPETYERGLHVIISSYVRNHPNACSPRVKSLNYLNNILAKAEAQDAGADEAIMLNVWGRVSECTGDNIFLVKNGVIHTPPAVEGILDGITRRVVIELAQKRGMEVKESLVLRHDLYTADEIFATGTAAEIIAVTQVEGRPVADGKPGPVTRQLLKDFIAYRVEG
jgi:branched-chain amino acid aminotransferase